jgi:hypothetical protein
VIFSLIYFVFDIISFNISERKLKKEIRKLRDELSKIRNSKLSEIGQDSSLDIMDIPVQDEDI